MGDDLPLNMSLVIPMDGILTESVGPRVINRRRSFQNERVLTIIVAPGSTQPSTYGLQFVRDVR
jgi:hypothetical protein